MCHIFIVCSFGSKNPLQCCERGCLSRKCSDSQCLSWELYLCFLPSHPSPCSRLWSQLPLESTWILNPTRVLVVKEALEEWGKASSNTGLSLYTACLFVSCLSCFFAPLFPGASHRFCSWSRRLSSTSLWPMSVNLHCCYTFYSYPFANSACFFGVWFSLYYFNSKIISQVFPKISRITQYLVTINGVRIICLILNEQLPFS